MLGLESRITLCWCHHTSYAVNEYIGYTLSMEGRNEDRICLDTSPVNCIVRGENESADA